MDIKKKYLAWIKERIGVESCEGAQELLSALYDILYFPTVGNDLNRAKDGLEIRQNFMDEVSLRGDLSMFRKRECNILEMMLGVCVRLEYQLLYHPRGLCVGDLFWILVKNLGLNEWSERDEVEEACDILNSRKYRNDGTGGSLFPISRKLDHEKMSHAKDFKKLEIWYQMMFWLQENFEF